MNERWRLIFRWDGIHAGEIYLDDPSYRQEGRERMLETKRKPVSVGTILVEEFLEPLELTQSEFAVRSGLPRKHVNELCRDRRAVTADTALILARMFGNSADFWLNTQRRTDVWMALNTPKRAERIARATPLAKRTSAA